MRSTRGRGISGDVPITKYETPGGQEFADTILPFVHRTNVMILANHGTVSYGETVEQAYWWTEILDSYCRMLMLSRQLGNVSYLSGEKSQELLDLKDKWGYKDPRNTPSTIIATSVRMMYFVTLGLPRR